MAVRFNWANDPAWPHMSSGESRQRPEAMMFSARPAPAPPDHPPLAEVKNQTAKRLVIASAIDDDDQLILPPFNTIRIADGDLATYRYEPWCKRGLITVRWSDERPAPTVAGRDTDAAVGPYGWLTTVIGVVVVAEAIPL